MSGHNLKQGVDFRVEWKIISLHEDAGRITSFLGFSELAIVLAFLASSVAFRRAATSRARLLLVCLSRLGPFGDAMYIANNNNKYYKKIHKGEGVF